KPQLEIRADDVRCAHGASIGQLDQEALFYLRTRGVSEAGARNILVRAFAEEIFTRVHDPAIRRYWERRAALKAVNEGEAGNEDVNSGEAGNSPPDTGGVAAPSRKSCEATTAAQTGWLEWPKSLGMGSSEEIPRPTTVNASPYRARASRPSAPL